MDSEAAGNMDVKVNISRDVIKNMSDLEKLTGELVESLNQAVKDNVITDGQAREALETARRAMMRMLNSEPDG